MFDSLDRRRLKILTLEDEITPEEPAVKADKIINAKGVVCERIFSERGVPEDVGNGWGFLRREPPNEKMCKPDSNFSSGTHNGGRT